MDVDAEGIILGDEDEGEIVIPSRGFYNAPSPGDDVTETLPGMAIKQEVQDEVYTDLYDDYEPEVMIPEGIPFAHGVSSPGGEYDEPPLEADFEVQDEFHDETEASTSTEPQQGPSSSDSDPGLPDPDSPIPDPPVTGQTKGTGSATPTKQARARTRTRRDRYSGETPAEYKRKLRSASKSVSSKSSK